MGNKVTVSPKIAILHSHILAWELVASETYMGSTEACFIIHAVKGTLSLEERAEYADYEAGYFRSLIRYQDYTDEALEVIKEYYKKHPERIPFLTLENLPFQKDIPDIVTKSKYKGQQGNDGRKFKRKLESLSKGQIQRWLKSDAFDQEEVKEAREWVEGCFNDAKIQYQILFKAEVKYHTNPERGKVDVVLPDIEINFD